MPEELDLDPQPLPPRGPRPSPVPVFVALLVLLALAGGFFYWFVLRSGRVAEVQSGAQQRAPATPDARVPPPSPAEASVPLPALAASDPFVRERLSGLSAEPSWPAWLAAEGLIARFAGAVAAVSEGKSPRQALDFVPVRGVFAVRQEGGRTLVDPASFARYDAVAKLLASIDPEKARPIWRLLHPLVERAWTEIAPPNRELDAVVLAALDHLLAAPVPPVEIEVVLADGLYRYTDPALEALSPAQQHLVRLGATNASMVREALRRLRAVVAG